MKLAPALTLLMAALVLLLASHLHDEAHRFVLSWQQPVAVEVSRMQGLPSDGVPC